MSKSPTATPDIEITLEMIEAARAVLAEHYLGDGVHDVSEPVIRHMLKAALNRQVQDESL